MTAAKRRSVTTRDQGSHWMSYSDLMAALLMVFMLLMFYSVYQYYNILEVKTQELDQQYAQFSLLQDAFNKSKSLFNEQEQELIAKQLLIDASQKELSDKEGLLNQSKLDLADKESMYNALLITLASKEKELQSFESILNMQRQKLDDQQIKLDNLVGVRARIIAQLGEALKSRNLGVDIDAQTGAITLQGSILFPTNGANLSGIGEEFLAKFMPVYLGVLQSSEQAEYISEIIIEGHTDTNGSYQMNLDLSLKRAQAVADYVLGPNNTAMTTAQKSRLREVVTVNGRSFSQPVYNAAGQVNMDSSRRVEFKFRLKDQDMIEEMRRLLDGM